MIDARRELTRRARPRVERVVHLDAIDLGDQRRNQAYRDLMHVMARKPGAHFTEIFPQHADLARFYRFCANPRMTFKKLSEPSTSQTRHVAREHPRVVVPHDTTELSFAVHNDKPRFQLARMSTNRQGFYGHLSLVLKDGPGFEPLAVAAMQPFVHRNDLPQDQATLRFWEQCGGLFDNEQQRFLRNLEACRESFEPGQALHVIDREGDDFKLLAWFAKHQERFLIRAAQDRNAQHEVWGQGRLSQLLEKQPVLGRRTVEVGYRPEKREKSKVVAERIDRTAVLELRAMRVGVERPTSITARERAAFPEAVELWVLEARELGTPPGQEPIVWRLLTSEPVEDLAAAEQVLAWYGARWRVEEYFKALKTGCAYSKRQLESAQSLLSALALLMPHALQLLRMRHQARDAPDRPAHEVFRLTQLQVLQTFVPRAPRKPLEQWTVREAFESIGLLGGWRRAPNRPLGWLVLGRGFQILLEKERAWNAALAIHGRQRDL